MISDGYSERTNTLCQSVTYRETVSKAYPTKRRSPIANLARLSLQAEQAECEGSDGNRGRVMTRDCVSRRMTPRVKAVENLQIPSAILAY